MDRFGDSRTRDKDKPTRQSPWVKDMLADNQQERHVGRDISESMSEKSTSNASNAHTTRNSVSSAPDSTDGKKEASAMEDMKELAKMINRTVEASLLKIQKQVDDLQNGYIKRNYSLHEDNTSLRATVMYYEQEEKRFKAAQELVKRLKKIIYWTFGSIAAFIIFLLLLIIWGWI